MRHLMEIHLQYWIMIEKSIFTEVFRHMEPMNDQAAAAQQLAKYKPKLQAQCIVKAVAGIFALLMIVLLFFVPFFEIKSTSELGELGDALDKLLGTFTFSVFDDAMHVIKLLSDGKLFDADEASILFGTLALFPIIAFLFLVVGAALIVADIGKDISKLLNIDNYVLETYDSMKSRRDETVKQLKNLNKLGWRFLMMGAMYEALAIVFLKISAKVAEANGVNLSGILTDPSLLVSDPYAGSISYFMLVNSITPSILFVIFAAIFAVIALIVQRKLGEQVKMNILKDDYHLGTRNETTVYPAYPGTQPPYYPPYAGQPQQPYPGSPYSGQPYAPPYPPQFYGQPYQQPSPESEQQMGSAPLKETPDRKSAAEAPTEHSPEDPTEKNTE